MADADTDWPAEVRRFFDELPGSVTFWVVAGCVVVVLVGAYSGRRR